MPLSLRSTPYRPPFKDFRLRRTHSFLRTKTSFSGTVGLTVKIVLLSLATSHQLDFVFQTFEVVAVALATVVVTLVCRDGETNWLEGLQLLAIYFIVAVAIWLLG